MENYVEVSLLNQGSYGTVQLVRDVQTRVHYAAKRISLALSNNAHVQAEIAVHRRLGEHPHIVQLFDDFPSRDGTEHILILEYCSGGDLHDSLARGRRPSSSEIRGFMLQLIDVLEHAHARGVYHRDVKPENVFLDRSGSVKLGDWGLASTVRQCTDFETGSDEYMAPECFEKGAKSYDAAKADIWALGIVLLNMLFGRTPFKQATERDPLFRDFCSSREALYDIFPALTVDVFAALREALALNPVNRSLQRFKEALLTVKTWTTDEEMERLERKRRSPLFAQAQQQLNRTSAKMVPVVHKPLRVPTLVARSLRTPPDSPRWDIEKMFTPPARRTLSAYRARTPQPELEQVSELDEEPSFSESSEPSTEDDVLVLGELESDDEPTGLYKILDKPPVYNTV